MQHVTQSPTEPGFVQNPYPFYDHARTLGPLVYWEAFGMPAAFGHKAVDTILRDRRFGREAPPEVAIPVPDHLTHF